MMAIGDGAELARAVRAIPGMDAVPVVMMSATAKSVATASVAPLRHGRR
jgi:CheY-like chemotaxis protein